MSVAYEGECEAREMDIEQEGTSLRFNVNPVDVLRKIIPQYLVPTDEFKAVE